MSRMQNGALSSRFFHGPINLGVREAGRCAKSSTQCFIVFVPGVLGGCSLPTCHHGTLFTAGSPYGVIPACSRRSIALWLEPIASVSGVNPAQRLRLLTARVSKPPKAAAHEGLMQAKRSRDANATPWLIRTDAVLCLNHIRPTFRIAMAAGHCCGPRVLCTPSSPALSLIPVTTTNGSAPRPPSPSKSFGKSRIKSASSYCQGVGSSSASLHGSIETEGWQKTSRHQLTPRGRFSTLPP